MAKDVRILKTRMTMDSKSWSMGMEGSTQSLNKFEKASKNVALGLGALTAATTTGVIGLGAIAKKNLDAFKPFDSALTDLGKVGVQNISRVRDEILNLPPALGKATELTQGYYQVISAGVTEPTKALDTLTVAAKSSQAAHVGQSEVIKGLTKVMAGYGDQIKDTTQASDLLFTIEKLGQTSFAELIPVVGGLASISAELNIKQDELGASLAQVSQFAGSTAEASTQYQAVLTGLMKPTEAMIELMDRYGGAQKAIKDLGFSKVMQLIAEETQGSTEALGELFGRKEATLGFIALAKEGFTGLNEKIAEMGNKTGATDRAFAEWKKTTEGLEAALTSNINETSIRMGEQLAPAYNAIISLTNEWFESNQDLIQNSISKIPILISEHIIPSTLGMIQSFSDAKTGLSLFWEWLHIKTIEAAGWLTKFNDFFREDTSKRVDETTDYMKKKHHQTMDDIIEGYEKQKTSLEGLQDLILKKITINQKERKDVVIDTNKKILDNEKQTKASIRNENDILNKKITEEEIKRLDDLYRLNEKFTDDINQITLSTLQYKEWALNQEYEKHQETLHQKNATTKEWATLDEWYAVKQLSLKRAIMEEERDQATSFFDFAKAQYDLDNKAWQTAQEKKVAEYKKMWDGLTSVSREMSSQNADTISDLLFDSMTNDMKSSSEYWEDYWKGNLRIATNYVSKIAVEASTAAGINMISQLIGSFEKFEKGAYKIEKDQLAALHRGEMVLPAPEAEETRRILEKSRNITKNMPDELATPFAQGIFGNMRKNFVSQVAAHSVATAFGAVDPAMALQMLATNLIGPAAMAGYIGKGFGAMAESRGYGAKLGDTLTNALNMGWTLGGFALGGLPGAIGGLLLGPSLTQFLGSILGFDRGFYVVGGDGTGRTSLSSGGWAGRGGQRDPGGQKGGTAFAQEGAIITKAGDIIPAGPTGVPIIGHPEEAIIPLKKMQGPTTVNMTNHYHFHGINAESSRSVVRDYIIPELNFWLTSQNQGKLF